MAQNHHPNASGGPSDSGGSVPPIKTRIRVVKQAVLEMHRSLQELIALQQRPLNPLPRGHGSRAPLKDHAFQLNLRPTVIEFPWFDGSEVNDWVFQANNSIQMMRTPPHLKVEAASHHLYGNALKWYKVKLKNREDDIWTWTDFVRCVVTRFSPKKADVPMADLSNLKQTHDVDSFVN